MQIQLTIHYVALSLALIFGVRFIIQAFLTYKINDPKWFNSYERATFKYAKRHGEIVSLMKLNEFLIAIISTVVFLTT